MVLHKAGDRSPLSYEDVGIPQPKESEVLVRVDKCGVCRTDLHVVEGDLPQVMSQVILGHEIVGKIAKVGSNVKTLSKGETVGIPWLHHTCGKCEYLHHLQGEPLREQDLHRIHHERRLLPVCHRRGRLRLQAPQTGPRKTRSLSLRRHHRIQGLQTFRTKAGRQDWLFRIRRLGSPHFATGVKARL